MATNKATFAGGCFWCTEAIFTKLVGVTSVLPGYSGGMSADPNYENIADHAEAIQIEFDDTQIKYETLLEVFFHTHDPTTLNRQGNDVGTQYRSVVFFHNDEQKQKAEMAITKIQSDFDNPIVTQIEPFKAFFEAEDYHKNYYQNNKEAAYCKAVIDPKLKKLIDNYSHLLKK